MDRQIDIELERIRLDRIRQVGLHRCSRIRKIVLDSQDQIDRSIDRQIDQSIDTGVDVDTTDKGCVYIYKPHMYIYMFIFNIIDVDANMMDEGYVYISILKNRYIYI